MRPSLMNLAALVAARGLSACVLLPVLAGCTVIQSQAGETPGAPWRSARIQTQIEFVDEGVARPVERHNAMSKSSDRMSNPGPPAPREAPRRQDREEIEPNIGPYLVQIAAYRSEERARSIWRDLESRAPLLLQGRVRMVERTEPGASGVVYRLRAGYFSDVAEAKAFCLLLDFAGDNCMIVRRPATDR